MKEIDVHELNNLLGSVNLVEIRESCQLDGSKIPTSEIIMSIGLYMNHNFMLDKEKHYYVAVLNKAVGLKAVKFLSSEGYNLTNVVGGTEEYSKHYEMEYVNK